ncbi:FAD-dependent oxidoreductase [Dactylosporangium sp. NPDC000555]|uniref:NAD(P)/FAD-dependent oxidoreductase n=1 Tax=Dactylosporangium sp. NPDC000555 TaxID=3154260 RepID=UPI003316DAA0
MTASDVTVVGGGVIGASIAYHLARRGVDVTLFDAADRTAGATVHSAGQIRMHHSDLFDCRLAALSLPTYERWAQRIGGHCGFAAVGFAFLADADRRAEVATIVAALTGLGIEATAMSPQRYRTLAPEVSLDGVGTVAVEPRSGYAHPARTTEALLVAAGRLGARVVRSTAVTTLRRHGATVTGVRTAAGIHHSPRVVVAAGVHSAALCATAGPQLRLRTRRVGWAIAVAAPPAHVIIDDTLGVYFRPHGTDRVLFGVPLDDWDPPAPHDPARPDTAAPQRDRIDRAQRTVAQRLPALREAPIASAAAAIEAYSPDNHPLIGPLPDLAGAYVCTGFSGGGFKVAPAVGEAVADEIDAGHPREELQPYRPDRFERGAAIAPAVAYRHM